MTLRDIVASLLLRASNAVQPRGRPIPLTDADTGAAQQSAHVAVQMIKDQQKNIPRPALLDTSMNPVQDMMQTNQAPQSTQGTAFPPGAPIAPAPTIVNPAGPRGYNYPIGYNIAQLPRSTEGVSPAELRALSASYEGIRICERVWFDILKRLIPRVTFEENIIPDGESENDPKWRDIATPAQRFIEYPDGITPIANWLCASVKDNHELGYSPIYLNRSRDGTILGLELVDAATIKPLIDDRGRSPIPPFPAYQQFLYGVPAGQYTREHMYIMREIDRTDSVYPNTRVEDIILRVNLALQKGILDLSRFTDGSIPEGLVIPDGALQWTPEQIEDYEQRFNGLLAGNTSQKVRMKFLPPGIATQVVQTRSPETHIDLDTYLLNITVAIFGLTMDEIAMTGSSNRSVGDSQQNVIYRRTVKPVAHQYATFFTRILKETFDNRLVLTWIGIEEEEDQRTKAEALQIGVKNGALSPSRMARMMGWPVDLEVPPMVVTKDGPVWLEDAMALRKAQQDAKLADLRFPTDAPLSSVPPAKSTATAKNDQDADPSEVDDSQQSPDQQKSSRLADYRRWKEVALKAVRTGRPIPSFVSDSIPASEHLKLSIALERCQTPEQVRSAFERSRKRAHPAEHVRNELQQRAMAIFAGVEKQHAPS